MEEEPVLREATARRDAALAEARKMDDFIRMYNELRGRPQLSVVDHGRPMTEDDEFMLDKARPSVR